MLDTLKRQYPEIPEQVLLKAGILFYGVQYHPCLIEAGDWAFPNFMPYHIPPDRPAYRGQRSVSIPYLLWQENGTQVRVRIKEQSPWMIRPLVFPKSSQAWNDPLAPLQSQPEGWSYGLFEADQCLTHLTFEPKLEWTDQLTSDGTPFKEIGLSQHGDMLVLNPAPGCEYFVAPFGEGKRNLSCQFCLYGLPDKRMDALGQTLFQSTLPTRQLTRIVDACSHPHTHARHLYLVSGSMVDMAQEGERFVQLAKALNDKGLHERYTIICGSGAIPKDAMQKMKALGVKAACYNLEVWDPKQFTRVCPGKAQYVGRDRWLEALTDAVDVFGVGQVMSAFVGGAELDGEGAFLSMDEALASNVEGADWLLSNGIQPIFSLHWKLTGKTRHLEPIYSLDHFLKLNLALAKLRHAYHQPINQTLFCQRCAYMQLEPDFDTWYQPASS